MRKERETSPYRSIRKRYPPVLALGPAVGLWLAVAAPPARSGDIAGHVTITRKLTKARVTLGSYNTRGIAVPLEADNAPSVTDELSRVVVYLEGRSLRRGEPKVAQLDQKDRRFEPEILVVPVGSTVSFPNSDPIFHNVFSLSKAKAFDLGYYPAGQTRTVRFDKPGIVQVFCHLHPNMSAAIVVTPNDWSARPAGDGTFALRAIPAGGYDLVVWHKSAGFFRREIEVRESGSQSVSFEIPLRSRKGSP